MVKWEELFQKYMVGCADRMTKVTRPLRNHLGIPFFGYHRIDFEGKYTVLTDRPDWAEFYLENEFYINDPYLKLPSEYSAGVSFFSHFGLQEKNPMIKAWGKKVQADEGIVLIEKKSKAVEFFIFAGNQQNHDFSKLYLNHLSLLRSFSNYFKKEMKSVLMNQQEEGYRLPISDKLDSTCQNRIDPKIEDRQKEPFLASIGYKAEWNLARSLTQREKECLKHLLEGKSIKGIATTLSLSPRTVEYYLVNVKNKIGCWNKEELVSKAKLLSSIDLL